MTKAALLLAAMLSIADPLAAQPAPAQAGRGAAAGRASAPAPAASAAKPGPGTNTTPAAESYVYQPDGRRDPFQSLIGLGSDSRAGVKRAEGPAGLTVAEVSVRGVLESRGALIAMVQGPDNKTFIVHQGDKFLDGTIRSITQQGLVIVQEVNDPLSLVKQREIRKMLRSLADSKE